MKLRIKVNSGLVTFRTVRDGASTAALDLPGGDFEYELSGDFTVEESVRYVTVKIVSERISAAQANAEWTYIDPWGDLKRGDFVRVPFGFSNTLFSGRVVAVDTALPAFLTDYMVKEIGARARFEDA